MKESGDKVKIPSKIKPVCEIVEYAKSLLVRFWYIAEMDPTPIDRTLLMRNKVNQIEERSKKMKKNIFTMIPKKMILGIAANKAVTDKIEPS